MDGDIEICPKWWPWPFHGPHPHLEDMRVPPDAQLTIAMFRALTVYNMGFQLEDKGARQAQQKLALTQLGEQLAQLQKQHG